jgi:cytochrome c biogenesis protein CcdA
MWVLIFLISLLLGMKDKKRMWILGSAFIVASASVYFIFMAAWLNLILFLGFVVWVRLIIGIVSLIGGGYSFREFFKNKSNTCKVTSGEKEQKIFDKLKNIVRQNNFWLALGGIILLSFMVNLVELVCSAGLPAMFTQVLAMNNLSTVQYHLYILLYIFFFMLDDLIVFFIAMFTLKMSGLSSKYARYTNLIGGILMVIIGLLLIFKPEVLMFG